MAADLQQKAARLSGALGRLAGACRLRLQRAERGLPDLPALLGTARQRLDDRAARLAMALPNLLATRRASLDRAERGMPDLPALIRAARQGLDDRAGRLRVALPGLLAARRGALALGAERLRSALRHAAAGRAAAGARVMLRLTDAPLRAGLREARARLEGLSGRLESVSYAKVLERGFALVADARGAPLTTAAAVAPGAALRLRFADGDVAATADRPRDTGRQGALPL